MDEQLDRLMSMTLPQVYALGEKPDDTPLELLLVPLGRIIRYEPSISDEDQLRLKKERMTKMLDDCGRDVHRKNQENIAIVEDALSSINEMVASKGDNGEDEVVKCIKDSSSLIRQTVTSIDDTIQDTLDSIKDQIQMEYETKQTMLMDSFDPEYFGLGQSSAWSGFAADSSKLLQARAGAYLKGQTAEKAENGEAIKVFLALFMSKFDSIEKSLGQIVVNIEKIQVKQEMLKDRQKNLEGLIKKRNEADRPKKLKRTTCVLIIVKILKEQYNCDEIKSESIEKMLYRWDKVLEKGEKIPVAGYDTARNNNISYFSDWVKVEFIQYYMEMRAKRMNKIRISSSEAACNEAARKKSRSMYDDKDNDYD